MVMYIAAITKAVSINPQTLPVIVLDKRCCLQVTGRVRDRYPSLEKRFW